MSSSSSPSSAPWEPPSPDRLQGMLPQYEIVGILGRGGMGAVYEARQVKLNRRVAIKLLPETFTQGEDELNFAKRFEQEAQAMAGLDHPAIISVYDFGETDGGQLYFVMEFVDGMDIHQYLHQHGGKLPQDQALAIVAHVLDALEYAHSNGIVHRDIKPANILLNRDGRVKIADFGLAKKCGEGRGDSVPALTMTSVAVGTPDFVAPEALDSRARTDHRADLYAVGVMLYQLLTGRIPRGAYRSPSEIDAEIDPRLDAIVAKAMAADPEDRYPSAAAVRADLDAIFSQPFVKIEADEDSSVVPAAVPVTTRVRGGEKAKTSPALVYGCIGLAAAIMVGVVMFATKGGKEDSPPEPPIFHAAAPIPETTAPEPAVPEPERVISRAQSVIANTEPAIQKPEPAPLAAVPPTPPEPSSVAAPLPAPATSKAPVEPEVVTPPAPAAPSVAPTALAPTPKSEEPSHTNQELLSIPGLAPRLDAYLAARRTRTSELAERYLRGLESRFNQAADAGDLALSRAYQGEKDRLTVLGQSLATPRTDTIAAIAAADSLPALAEGSPDGLVALRGVWDGEYQKLREDLDAKLRLSLQALETELTKARDLDNAGRVLALRENLKKAPVSESGANLPPVATQVPAAPSLKSPATGDLASATKDKPFENTLGMKFVPVPGTDVLFCIHETRYRDYEEYAKKANQSIDGSWKNQATDGIEIKRSGEDHPASWISWDDAQAFCHWLSEKEGKTYRLPTDREWSIAVGIGDAETWDASTTPSTVAKPNDRYPWSGGWPPPAGVGNYSDESRKSQTRRAEGEFVEGGYDDGFPTTAPVMSFAPNEFGLYDLGGNVWEWCEDPFSNNQQERVIRGASWSFGKREDLLSSCRFPNDRTLRFYGNRGCGFRIVLETGTASAPAATKTPPSAPAKPATSVSATKDKPFENSLGMKFVPVPDTDVLFCIHETRYRDYEEYAKKAKESVDGTWRNQKYDGFDIKSGAGDHPVTYVSWEDAKKFCAWLSEKEAKSYRLPTDREWSLAVGIGDFEKWEEGTTPANVSRPRDRFPWGGDWPPPPGIGNYSDESRKARAPNKDAKYIEGYDDGFPTTAPVMRFAANEVGLFDLGGNVWEWCEDWYSDERKDRVLRGGSWGLNEHSYLLSSYRKRDAPNGRSGSPGFRIVLETAAAPPSP